MSTPQSNFNKAVQDFQSARQRALLEGLLARIKGEGSELFSYDDVAEKLKLRAKSDVGIRSIPVKAIVGSVGRYTDFTRSFMPRRDADQQRWARVKALALDPLGPGWPPIEVYKVGSVYFVLDGNHRVSIARQEGMEKIEAHVIEVESESELTPDMSPDDLIREAEFVDFIDRTSLKKTRPNVDLKVTVPGQHPKLLDQIETHASVLRHKTGREISFHDAAVDWYDHIYSPFVEAVRDRGLLRWFPGRTVTDLFVFVSEHRAQLEDELGWYVGQEAAATDLVSRESQWGKTAIGKAGGWRESRMVERYMDRLFKNILVPLSGQDDGWQALQQAAVIANKESSTLLGLHVVRDSRSRDLQKINKLRSTLEQICNEHSLEGYMATDTGAVDEKIIERSTLADLVVIRTLHPPGKGISGLGSSIRSILLNSVCPVLCVTGEVTELNNAILAFDDSSKSREALFIATYIAETWKTRITVLTVSGSTSVGPLVQENARKYLEFHEIEAGFEYHEGSVEKILEIARERKADLILMGGYRGSIFRELMVGSTVTTVLKESTVPVLVCQ